RAARPPRRRRCRDCRRPAGQAPHPRLRSQGALLCEVKPPPVPSPRGRVVHHRGRIGVGTVAEEEMDVNGILSDAYRDAVNFLVCGDSRWRTRLRAALSRLAQCRKLLEEPLGTEVDETHLRNLASFLADWDRLEKMNLQEMADLAYAICEQEN